MRLLVTGGAGFIGSAFICYALKYCKSLVNLDSLTYAADLANVESVASDRRYFFVQGDICDESLVESLCVEHQIDVIVHFAAETHVDRSIISPGTFFLTNVQGTLALLQVVRRLPSIHFHHISTDEVYGQLGSEGAFHESSPYSPNSPYAASKASADHLVRAFAHTYGLSTTISCASNNYGPSQYPEKFIPRMLTCCLTKTSLPLYGKGENVRDWLYVEDHARAVWQIVCQRKKGETYNVGGGCEMRNIDLADLLIDEVAKVTGEDPAIYRSLITFVPDRPGHDLRYALDCTKIQSELGWRPQYDLLTGLKKTIEWYVSRKPCML